MATKGLLHNPRAPELKPHPWMQFIIIPFEERVLPFCWGCSQHILSPTDREGIYLPNPFTMSRMSHMVKFWMVLKSLNSEFSFSLTSFHTKVKEFSLSYYLPITGGRIVWFGLVWFGFIAYQPLLVNYCQILFIHIYIYQIYIWLVTTFCK